MLADILTVSRIIFSFFMLGLSVYSRRLRTLYIICGITDVLDGFTARTLHTESERGSRLDSVADLFFAAVYAVKILPSLHLPRWILLLTAGVAVLKIRGIAITGWQGNALTIRHSFSNRLTGILIFLLPLSVRFMDVRYSAAAVSILAACTAAAENISLFLHREISKDTGR